MSEAARGVVVGHGSIAAGLVDAVRSIAGSQADALVPISNEGCAPEDLRRRIADAAGEGDGPLVVFADLHSGSCGAAAYATCRESKNRAVVCGVNLPILLDFVFHRDLPLDELVPRLLEKGRQAILPLEPA